MAGGQNFVLDKGYKPAAAITQFQLVKLSADDTVTPVTAVSDQTIGVCQETVSTADSTNQRICDIRLMGISRVVAAASITRGTPLRCDTTGKVQPLVGTAGVNEVVVGIALAAANTNDIFDMLLTPGGRSNTATT